MANRKTPENLSRRQFLAGLAAAQVAALAGCERSSVPGAIARAASPAAALPDPADTGIDHIVVLMMENRSFDHYFGWLPGADGVQAGLRFKDSAGTSFDTHPLAPNYQSCASADPDHSYAGGRTQYHDGKLDGWLLTAPAGDSFPIGYFTADDLPFFKGCAENWTVCDRYFSGLLSDTWPNRMYMHSGRTDRLKNGAMTSLVTVPAIWDRLADKGRTGTYYYSDLPVTAALYGQRFLSISKLYSDFLADAAAGTLPDVSYVDPNFGGESQGLTRDDHPLADIRDGQAFLNETYDALRASPAWERTLLIVNYDEWGGFRDHVPPPLAPVSDEEKNVVGNDGRLGFRVPCVLIGPRAKKAHVEHMQLDPNAILNLICWRFGLETLGVRAATSGNLGYALDFANAPRSDKPAFTVAAGPFGMDCDIAGVLPPGVPMASLSAANRSKAEHLLELQSIRAAARRDGFVW